jgi:hypothetical protein
MENNIYYYGLLYYLGTARIKCKSREVQAIPDIRFDRLEALSTNPGRDGSLIPRWLFV